MVRPLLDQELFDQLHELAGRSLNGELTDEETSRLDRLVCGNAEARRLYVQYVHGSCWLRTWARYPLTASLGDAHKSAELGEPVRHEPSVHRRRSRFRRFVRPMTARLAVLGRPGPLSLIVSTVVLTVLLAALGRMQIAPLDRRPADASGRPQPVFVAQLARAVNCRWGGDAADAPIERAWLRRGEQLQLDEGLAELRFGNGARLVMTGPVGVTLDGLGQVQLDHGRLSALVPKQAQGFTVRTPTANIVDYGTEFGVYVDPQGETEVLVVQGGVEVQPIGAEQQAHRLEAGQAVRVVAGEQVAIRRIAADADQYVRVADSAGPVPHDGLNLWLAADHLPFDDGDFVPHWPDYTGRHTPAVAIEGEVTYQTGAIGGRPAVRLAGGYLQLPRSFGALSGGITIAAVYRPAGPDRNFDIIGRMGGTSKDRGFMLAQRDNGQLLGASYRSGELLFTATSPAPAQIGQPTMLVYVRGKDSQQLFSGGQLVAETYHAVARWDVARQAGAVGAGWSTQPIHRVSYGDIAEILVYDRALGASDRSAVEQYLRDKYFTPSSSSD